MDYVEAYARQWAKHENEDIATLSECVIKLQGCTQSMNNHATSIIKDVNAENHLSYFHYKYVVHTIKTHSNIVSVCKSHYMYLECFIAELGIVNSLGNLTYTSTKLTKEEILNNHRSVFCFFCISNAELGLPLLYLIMKLHMLTNSVILMGLSNAPRNIFLRVNLWVPHMEQDMFTLYRT